eukprot:1038692-Pelagomonas_calceolata.AAC.1
MDIMLAGEDQSQADQPKSLAEGLSFKSVNHTILLGVGGTCYTEHTLDQSQQLELDHQRAIKLANRLHAHSVKCAHKLVTARRAIDNCNTSRSH